MKMNLSTDKYISKYYRDNLLVETWSGPYSTEKSLNCKEAKVSKKEFETRLALMEL
jgi:hypothetical protein